MSVFVFLIGCLLVVLGIWMLRFSRWHWVAHILALTAWLPFTFWAVVTGNGAWYPFLWFWLPLALGIPLALLSVLPKVSTLRWVRLLGCWLLLVAVFVTVTSVDAWPWTRTSSQPKASTSCYSFLREYLLVEGDITLEEVDSLMAKLGTDQAHLAELHAKNSDAQQADLHTALSKKCGVIPKPVKASFKVTTYPHSLNVTFNAGKSEDRRNHLKFIWSLDDPNRADDKLTETPLLGYTYSVAGRYTVEVKVIDKFGRYATASRIVEIPKP